MSCQEVLAHALPGPVCTVYGHGMIHSAQRVSADEHRHHQLVVHIEAVMKEFRMNFQEHFPPAGDLKNGEASAQVGRLNRNRHRRQS